MRTDGRQARRRWRRGTAGALRSEVAGWDVSPVSQSRHRGPKVTTYGGIVGMGYRQESEEAKEVARFNEHRSAGASQ